MRVLIIEDGKYAFSNICRLLQQVAPDIAIDGPVTNCSDLRIALQEQQAYDFIITDIQLEDGSCFEVLRDMEITIPIIFATAFEEHALSAFRVGGVDYLLKPFDAEDLKKAIDKALRMKTAPLNTPALPSDTGNNAKKTYRTRIMATVFNGVSVLDVNDISHITIQDGKVIAFLHNGESAKLEENTLDEVENALNPAQFFRANRQYIVSLNSISRLNNYFNQTRILHLKGFPKLEIKISKEKYSHLKNWINMGG